MNGNHHIGLLILRLTLGVFMIFGHGWSKMMKILNGDMSFGDPLGIGEAPSLLLVVFAEVICSILLIIGFKTRWAVLPLIITMLVAFFIVHFDDPFARQEKALLYLGGYVALLFLGAGKYSVDGLKK